MTTDTAAPGSSQRPEFADDADLSHPWVARWRIPLVANWYPRWFYEVAVAVPREATPTHWADMLQWPDEDEAAVIGSYIGYRRDWYTEGWQEQMLTRPLDVDSGTNTVILIKTTNGWRYRCASFEGGPWPTVNEPEWQAKYPPTKYGLIALIRHAARGNVRHDFAPYGRFEAWMDDHPEVWAIPTTRAL